MSIRYENQEQDATTKQLQNKFSEKYSAFLSSSYHNL